MAEPNLAEAIGLQTQATPYRGTPVTTGIRINQENELRKQLKQAEIDAKKQRVKDARNKAITITPPPVSQRWASDVTNEAIDTYHGMMDERDANNPSAEWSRHQQGLGNINSMSKTDQFEIDLLKSGTVLPKHIVNMLNSKDAVSESKALNGFDPDIHDYIKVVDAPRGRKTVRLIYEPKPVNLNDEYNSLLKSALGLEQSNKIGTDFAGYYGVKKDLEDEDFNRLATTFVDFDKDSNATLSRDSDNRTTEYKKDFQMRGLPLDQAVRAAKIKVVNEDLKAKYAPMFGLRGKTDPYKNDYKNDVSVETVEVNNNPFFPGKQVIDSNISTPVKGENEMSTFQINTGFVVDPDTKKLSSVSLKGKRVKGSVINVVSEPTSDGRKSVWAIMETNALTDGEANPEKYKEFNSIKSIPEVKRTKEQNAFLEDNKDLGKKAEKQTTTLIKVPLRDVAKNLKAEWMRYNKFNLIKKIENEHGIKYSDYTESLNNSEKAKNHANKYGL